MLKQTIKNSILGGIVFSLTVMIFGLSYSAWTLLSTETPNQPLTAAKWNAIIDRLNSIDQKQLATAWVNFNGASCTGGSGANECIIRDSYNVSKVIRSAVGDYLIYFLTAANNSSYSVNTNTTRNPHAFATPLRISEGHNFLTDRFSVVSGYLDTNSLYVAEDRTYLSVQVFGGK